jgi:hypothetical protein
VHRQMLESDQPVIRLLGELQHSLNTINLVRLPLYLT